MGRGSRDAGGGGRVARRETHKRSPWHTLRAGLECEVWGRGTCTAARGGRRGGASRSARSRGRCRAAQASSPGGGLRRGGTRQADGWRGASGCGEAGWRRDGGGRDADKPGATHNTLATRDRASSHDTYEQPTGWHKRLPPTGWRHRRRGLRRRSLAHVAQRASAQRTPSRLAARLSAGGGGGPGSTAGRRPPWQKGGAHTTPPVSPAATLVLSHPRPQLKGSRLEGSHMRRRR